jgi:hypothetical protein
MALDPSIPLQFRRPRIMNPVELVNLRDVVTTSNLRQQQLDEEARAMDILRRPGAIDPATGTVSMEALSRLYQVSPRTGMQASQQRQVALSGIAQAAQAQAKAQQQARESAFDRLETVTRFGSAALSVYDDDLRAGRTSEEALAHADEVYQDIKQQMRTQSDALGNPLFDEESLAAMSERFDPSKARAGLAQIKGYRDRMAADFDKAPHSRTRAEGDIEITEDWIPGKGYVEISRGPRWKAEEGEEGGPTKTERRLEGADVVTYGWEPSSRKWTEVARAPRWEPPQPEKARADRRTRFEGDVVLQEERAPDGTWIEYGRRNRLAAREPAPEKAPSAPAGYQWTDEEHTELRPIPGGPADKQAKAAAPPSGYQWTEEGNLRPIPGGPADKAQARTRIERRVRWEGDTEIQEERLPDGSWSEYGRRARTAKEPKIERRTRWEDGALIQEERSPGGEWTEYGRRETAPKTERRTRWEGETAIQEEREPGGEWVEYGRRTRRPGELKTDRRVRWEGDIEIQEEQQGDGSWREYGRRMQPSAQAAQAAAARAQQRADEFASRAPTTRHYLAGDQLITEQWNAQSRAWEQIAQAPREAATAVLNADRAGIEMYERRLQLLEGVNARALQDLNDARRQGMSEEDALARAQKVYEDELARVGATGFFGEGEKSRFPKVFDEQRARDGLASTSKFRHLLDAAKAPFLRTILEGDQQITLEWKDGQWEQIASAPRWSAPGAGSPKVIEVAEGDKTVAYQWTGDTWSKIAEGPRWQAAGPQGTVERAPPMRTILEGGEEVQKELRDGKWIEIGRGPRWRYLMPEGEAPAKPGKRPQEGALRKYDKGNTEITEEYSGGKWREISRSPKWKPEEQRARRDVLQADALALYRAQYPQGYFPEFYGKDQPTAEDFVRQYVAQREKQSMAPGAPAAVPRPAAAAPAPAPKPAAPAGTVPREPGQAKTPLSNIGKPQEKALPLPKSKEQLQRGQLYQTPQGRGRWNGSRFIPE